VPIQDFKVDLVRSRVSIGLVLDDSGRWIPSSEPSSARSTTADRSHGAERSGGGVSFTREIQS